MSDKIDSAKIVSDISLLYELSLAVGNSLDLRENCEIFLERLMARKNLAYASVWIKSDHLLAQDASEGALLVYANPESRIEARQIPDDHPLFTRLTDQAAFSLTSADSDFSEMVIEKEITTGAFAVFALGEIGFLKVYSAIRTAPFDNRELRQLAQVIDKFALSLQGCFAHQQAIQEIAERQRVEVALAKRASELETVAQVGMTTSTILEPDHLLQSVVDLTKERFDLYHAHIYLLNQAEDALNLAAGAGKIGRNMVNQGWSIPFGHEQSLVARVARSRQGVLVNDVRQAPDFLKNPLLPDTLSELAAPMIIGDTLLGVLDVQADTIDYFSDEDVNVQTTLASQIAVALQNSQSFAQTQVALAETEMLYDMSAELNATQTLDEVLEAAISPSIASGVNYANLFTIEGRPTEGPEWLVLKATWGPQGQSALPLGTRLSLQNYPGGLAWLANPNEPLMINDIYNDDRIDKAAQADYQSVEAQANITLPLKVGSDWVGLISLNWPTPQAFTEKDSRLYKSLSAQAAVRVSHHLLFEQTERALTVTEALYQGSSRVSRAATLDDALLALITSTALKQLDRANIMFFDRPWADQQPETMTVAAVWERSGQPTRAPIGTLYPLARWPTTKLLRPDEPLVFRDALSDERVDQNLRAMLEMLNMQSLVVFPLVAGGRWIGIVTGQGASALVISDDEIRQINNLTDQTAVVIQNRRLLARSQARAERERQVRVITDKIRRGMDRTTILQIAQEEIGHLLGASDSAGQLGTRTQLLAKFKQQSSSFTENGLRAMAVAVETQTTVTQSSESNDQSLAFPVSYADEVIGVLGFDRDQAQTWDDEDIATAEAVIEQAGQALENQRLFDQIQMTLIQTERLSQISAQLNAATNPKEILEAALAPALATGVTNAGIFTFDLDRQGQPEWAEALVDLSEKPILPPGHRIYLPEFPLTKMWLSDFGRALVVSDSRQDPRLDPVTREFLVQTNSLAGVIMPLTVGERRVGQIALGWDTPQHFTEQDKRLYEAIATQAGTILDNHLLLEQTQREIGERRASEEALRINEERSRALLDAIPDLIVRYNRDGLHLDVNSPKGFATFLPPQELIGKSMEEVMSPELAQQRLHYMDLAFETNEVQSYEQHFEKEGEIQYEEVRVVPSGREEVFVIVQDITERKAAEAEQERLLAEVQAAYRQYVDQEWGQLLAEQHQGHWRIEHQPRQPLTEAADLVLSEAQQEVLALGETKVVAQANGNGQRVEASIVAPLTLRGKVIGTLGLQDVTPDRQWTREEIALVETVSEQLTQTIENLRLFDDTQKQAGREQLTRHITDKMRAAPDVDSIIKTGLTELAQALGVSRTYVKLTTTLNKNKGK